MGDAPKLLCSEFGDGEVGIAWPQCWPQSHRTLLGSARLSQPNQHNHTSWLVTHAGQRPSNSSVWAAWTQAAVPAYGSSTGRWVVFQSNKQNKLFGISREGLASFSCYFLTNVAHLRGNSRSCQAAQLQHRSAHTQMCTLTVCLDVCYTTKFTIASDSGTECFTLNNNDECSVLHVNEPII